VRSIVVRYNELHYSFEYLALGNRIIQCLVGHLDEVVVYRDALNRIYINHGYFYKYMSRKETFRI